ncbi:MAG: hypothetical protein LBU83_05640 [Bacteroidales bacterium]|nr:hypothetical protein [Bacteroidales bacterium]
MKKSITILFLLFLFFLAFSQDDNLHKTWGYKGYAGGMFIHVGYIQSNKFKVVDLQGNEIEQQIKGFTYGLGGKMSIWLNRFFKVGGEGYFSTCNYGVRKNSCRIGWGGIAFDLLYPIKKWAPFIGVTLGGGRANHLIFIEKQQNNTYAAPMVHFSYPLCIINPAVGIEFLASNRISVLLKMDYMLNVYKKQNTYPHGMRLYLGVHFYQKKMG